MAYGIVGLFLAHATCPSWVSECLSFHMFLLPGPHPLTENPSRVPSYNGTWKEGMSNCIPTFKTSTRKATLITPIHISLIKASHVFIPNLKEPDGTT